MSASAPFTSDIALLDEHIDTIMDYCDADYAQISLVAIGLFGFILAHAGMKQTSLMVLDFSHSGTGKSHNITLQTNALLVPIIEEQSALQISANEGEEKNKRFSNIHLDAITVAGLYESFKTVRAQLIIDEEMGLNLKNKDDILHTITKLYGKDQTTLPVLKTEAPSGKALVPIALSFIGATTLQYFGSKEKLRHHLLGGFVNRALIVCNHRLKKPEELTMYASEEMDTAGIHKQIRELLLFLRSNTLKISFCPYSQEILHRLKQDIQAEKYTLHEEGNASFSVMYNRIKQNSEMIARIFHALKCFENGKWEETIDPLTTESAITYVKLIVYPQIETLFDYLIDKPKLAQEEKQLKRIITVVNKHLAEHGTFPTTSYVTTYSRANRDLILRLTKGFYEIEPGSCRLRYCNPLEQEATREKH